jgi:hypothetical protein
MVLFYIFGAIFVLTFIYLSVISFFVVMMKKSLNKIDNTYKELVAAEKLGNNDLFQEKDKEFRLYSEEFDKWVKRFDCFTFRGKTKTKKMKERTCCE